MIPFLKLWIELYITFFVIGLLTIGGGLAALPLLQEAVLDKGWMTMSQFADMIAISQATPGPIGINTATYVGYIQLGVLGSVVATLGMVTPSIIIILMIAKFLKHFNENIWVKGALLYVRPVVIGLIFTAAYFVGRTTFTSLQLPTIAFAVGVYYFNHRYKGYPLVYLALGALAGLFFLTE